MPAGVIGTVFGAAFIIGLVAVITFSTARRKAAKSGPGARAEFSPRGFRGVVLLIGGIAALLWAALLMAFTSDWPTWVYSVGIVFFIALVRPAVAAKYGPMFVVRGGRPSGGEQSGAPHYGAPHYAAPHAGGTEKPLTRGQADLWMLYVPAASGATVALLLGFGANWIAAGIVIGLAVIAALAYTRFRSTGRGEAERGSS